MRLAGSATIALAFILAFTAATAAGCTCSCPDDSQHELTDIVATVLANPHYYEGQQVTIVGYYRGWDLLDETGSSPPVTRSDWVIKDATGAIYVSAASKATMPPLDPTSLEDVNTILKVVGTVNVSAAGQPYLEAESVEAQP